jgi:hypothetical protein
MEGLASVAAERKTVMFDATYLKTHRTASSLRVKKGARKGHQARKRRHEQQATCRHQRAAPDFLMIAGEVSDYIGAAAQLRAMPSAERLLADRKYDADWYREALKDKEIRVCNPDRNNHKKTIRFDRRC